MGEERERGRLGTPVPAYERRFGRYTLIYRLAGGGMAEVYLARLATIGGFEKYVFLKILLPELAREPKMVSLFAAEARVAGGINHANVCEIRETGEAEGTYYIVYEHLVGVPIGALVKRMPRDLGARDLRLTAGLVEQACEGLHAAHEAGLVHRDITPGNLFVTAEGMVKVLDLGVEGRDDYVKRTGPGRGTYAYQSPEQIQLEPLDRRANVFSVAVITFELVTGRRLFNRETDYLLCRAITEDPIPQAIDFRPEIPRGVNDAIRRALSRDRHQRFPSTRAFAEAVASAVRPLGGALYAAAIREELEKICGPELTALEAPRPSGVVDQPMSNVPTKPMKRIGPAPKPDWFAFFMAGVLAFIVALGLAYVLFR